MAYFALNTCSRVLGYSAIEVKVFQEAVLGRKIPAIFLFYGPEKIIKLAKNKIKKIEKNLNNNRSALSTGKCIDISYKAYFWMF